MVLQGLESSQGHGSFSNVQLEIYYVYISEVHFTMVGKTSTKVMDSFSDKVPEILTSQSQVVDHVQVCY